MVSRAGSLAGEITGRWKLEDRRLKKRSAQPAVADLVLVRIVTTRHCLQTTSLLVAIALAGCLLPLPIAENPHVAGWVLDAATKRPVVGATLQFERFQERPVVTAASGRFDIPEIQRVKLYPLPLPDVYAGSRYLLVHAPGYLPTRLAYSNYKTHLHETILLKRR
jgi:hypothetical protein